MSRRRKSVAEEDASDKTVYLVVEHKGNKEPSHSIVIAGGTRAPPVMVPLHHAIRGMSFAAADSRWIFGVGGDSSCPSTVYDLSTSTESAGPIVLKNKVNPILIPHRGLLYVLSSRPKIHNIECPDFLPWFELIRFTNGKGGLADFDACPPCELPPPPIFPYCINPIEYANPPDVRVAAYAVVDSHILLSVAVSFHHHHQQQQEDKGTCAFDMDRQVWDMVDTKSLPFLGQAIPIGDHLFVAHSKDDDGAAEVYYMAVFPAKDTPTGKTELSMVKSKLDLPRGGIVAGQQLCALGMRGCFSSFDFPSVVHHGPGTILEKARVIQRIYSLVKGADDLNKVVKWQRRIFKLLDPSHLLARPASLVAAFTLDSE
uniref:Uncharacterized protein n=1 Tax=Avena sativa TaxID=4498 RepID=A0ACD5TSN5_AVESA